MPFAETAVATAPIWAPIAGSMLQGVAQSAFNAAQSQKQMDFQERMSNTAHQREVKDLLAAGLNPILSARHGGASSPPGASAQAQAPDVAGTGIQARLANGTLAVQQAQVADLASSSALKNEQTKDTMLTRQSRIDLMIAQKEQAISSGHLNSEQINRVKQEIQNLKATKLQIENQTASSAAQLHKEQVKGELWKVPETIIKKGKEIGPGLFDRGKQFLKKIQKKARGNPGASGRW